MRWEDDDVRMTSQGVRTWGVCVDTPPLGPSLKAEGPHYLTLHGTGAVDTSLAVLLTRNRICQIYAHSHPTLRRQAQLADGTIHAKLGEGPKPTPPMLGGGTPLGNISALSRSTLVVLSPYRTVPNGSRHFHRLRHSRKNRPHALST